MDPVAVAERVHRIVAVRDDAAACDDLIESGLVAVREVQAWADAQHAVLVAKLSADGFVEARVAKASKTSLGAAVKATQRSRTLATTPKLAGALGDGATTAAHIDVVTRAQASYPRPNTTSCWPAPTNWWRSLRCRRLSSSLVGWPSRRNISRPTTASIVSPVNAAMFGCRHGSTPTGCGTCADCSIRSPGYAWPPNFGRRSRRCSPRRSRGLPR